MKKTLGLLFLLLPCAGQAQFTYSTNGSAITLTEYSGSGDCVTVSNFVTSIGDVAFSGCATMTNITIPASVTSIGDEAFGECTNLTAAYFQGNAPSADPTAFWDDTTAIAYYVAGTTGWNTWGGGIPTISYSTNGSVVALTGYTGSPVNLTIPSFVTSIGDSALYYCTSLTNVTIPNSVNNIGTLAFENCHSLTSVTIGNSVNNIGTGAFSGCTILSAINVAANNASYSSLAGVLFDKAQTTLIQFPGGGPTTYAIPNSVTSISDSAFAFNLSLTRVSIPNSVTNIGDYAFQACNSLTSVTIPNSVTSIGGDAFAGCRSMTSLTIGNGATNIGGFAFSDCSSLTNVTIGNSVTSIGIGAFWICTSLTSVTIPNSVTSIGPGAFESCPSLEAVYFQGNAPLPTNDPSMFSRGNNPTAYYLPGTTGWDTNFDGIPTALWTLPNPAILNNTNFGVQAGVFSFTVSWAANATVIVEACTNLARPLWQPLQTNTLTATTNNGFFTFSDTNWTHYPIRFYRIRSP